MSRRLVILDRDGVINHDSDEFIKSPEEWRPIDGSLDAIEEALSKTGLRGILCYEVSDRDGKEIARGLVNYSAAEARQIMGKASHEIEATLGYVDEPELIHRDNLVLL